MIQRLKCFLAGHKYSFRAQSVPGRDNTNWLYWDDDRRYAKYGFTILTKTCARCGVAHQQRVLGMLGDIAQGDELAELRKMAGLK